MKNLYPLLILLFLSLSIYAQSPDKMSYQAVVRDANNTLVANQTVGMQISILQSTITGTVVYTEIHSVDTNLNGLVSLEIGNGSSSDNFSEIDWSAGPYFIKTETDPTGGSSYTITGTSQLMSVPFALYATTSGSSQTNATNITNNTTAIETNTTAIELNTAKVGITTEQSNAITANTAKVGYTEAAVSANTDVVANTAKVGITTEQSDAITANTAKVGITTNQSDAITANTAKVVITTDQSDAIVANTAKVGITTSQADAIVANSSNIIAISFFSDCNNLTGIGSAPINLIDVDLGDNILTGFPILPSGAGAFYNNFGAAIDVPAPVPTSGRGYTYGEYMPYDGEIVGAAINLTSKSATGNPEPLAMKYFAACYGGGSPFITELIGEKASGADEGSIFYNTTGAVGFESVTGLIQPHPGVPAAIPFGSGSYIGIFVDNPSPSVDVVVSGTLYVKINN